MHGNSDALFTLSANKTFNPPTYRAAKPKCKTHIAKFRFVYTNG